MSQDVGVQEKDAKQLSSFNKRLETLKLAREALAQKRRAEKEALTPPITDDSINEEVPPKTTPKKPPPPLVRTESVLLDKILESEEEEKPAKKSVSFSTNGPTFVSRKELESKNPLFELEAKKPKKFIKSLTARPRESILDSRIDFFEQRGQKRKRQEIEQEEQRQLEIAENERIQWEQEKLQQEKREYKEEKKKKQQEMLSAQNNVVPAQNPQSSSSINPLLSTLGTTTIQILGAIALLFISIATKGVVTQSKKAYQKTSYSGTDNTPSSSSGGFQYYR